MTTPSLTPDDHMAMHQAGFCVTLRFGGFRLERLPTSNVFRDDACAWLHVYDLALERVPLGVKVLAFLEEHDALEFDAIARYISIYRPNQVENLKRAA